MNYELCPDKNRDQQAEIMSYELRVMNYEL